MAEAGVRNVVVVGAGLAGSLTAIYLGKAGHRVTVYEGRPDPRSAGYKGGRSINLALSTRGLHALARAGLHERVLERAVPMRGRMLHSPTGRLAFQPYGTRGQAINSVSRGELNLCLIEAADALPNVSFCFDIKCTSIDLDRPAVEVLDRQSGSLSMQEADVVVGADGAFSVVRNTMQRLPRFNYSQSYLEHGYKELTIPPGPDGMHAIAREALHIWPRGGTMMIALPNHDGSFTCTLFWPFEGEHSFEALASEQDVAAFFQRHFPDAPRVMPTLTRDYMENPTSSLVTVRCYPWQHRGRVVLVGDACHAVVPFYGQGANAAFEDCVVLDECLERHPDDLERAFSEYQRSRKENVDALADLAIANFLEMRDHVAAPSFLWKKRLEKTLHRLLPARFLPLYSMVTFSRIPYAEALRRHRLQTRWLVRLLALAGGGLVALLVLLVYLVAVR